MGDEDSTAAAGHGLGTSGRTQTAGRPQQLAGTNAAFFGRGDSGGGQSGGAAWQQLDDEDDSVDANKAKEPRAYPRGIVAPIDRVRSHKLPAMNSVHVPLRNPVFAAFTACGTRLLLMTGLHGRGYRRIGHGGTSDGSSSERTTTVTVIVSGKA